VNSALRNFERLYLKDLKFLGGDRPNIGDLIAFHDITMLEVLDFNYTPYVKIRRWVEEMRKFEYIRQANEKFEESKDNLKSLRKKPEPKL
jgi:glutathione S-transferase